MMEQREQMGLSDGGEFDVIVAGGGASGVIAAIAAARLGARTLLLERQGCLGGTATTSYVSQYVGFYNHDVRAVWGIADELIARVQAAGGSNGFDSYMMGEAAARPLTIRNFPFNPEIVKLVQDEMVIEAGVKVLLHVQTVDVISSGSAVEGVIVQTVAGRKAYRARVVVDATGDAVIAQAAGVAMDISPVRQPSTLCFRLGQVDIPRFRALPRAEKRAKVQEGLRRGELFWQSVSFIAMPSGGEAVCFMSRINGKDALDEADASEMEMIGRAQIRSIVAFLRCEMPGFENAVLTGIAPRVGVRETRRIVGQYTLTAEDILAERTFTDTIALGCGPMDIHEPGGTGIELSMPPAPFEIPMRCLLPREVEGLIVTGRAISATQEANGGARHMATAMALGHAAGIMAALAAAGANSIRHLSGDAVRDHLRRQGAALDVADCRRLMADREATAAP